VPMRAITQAASLALALTVAGCGLFASTGPTQVARGEYYAAGKPEYDAFFIELHQKQVELLAAPSEPKKAREGLTQATGLMPDASDESLRERIQQELRKLGNQGLRLRLEAPAPTSTLDASATLHASDTTTATPLREVLPRDTTRLVRSRNAMLAAKAALEKLRVKGIQLEGGIEQAFRVDGPWKRDEVRRNLADGQKLITLMQSRAQEVFDEDQRLIDLVTAAATSDPSVGRVPVYAAPAPPDDSVPKVPKRGPRGHGAPRPAAAQTPATSGKPPGAAAKPRDDEAPAPKPTQGTAPAEIEP
jgi:hypothetical protein